MALGKNVGDQVFEKAEPSLSDLHVNRPLSNVSIAYAQDEEMFVAPDVFAKVMSERKSDSYFIFDESDFHRDEAEERGPGDESVGSGYGLTSGSFSCRRYSYHKDIPMEDLQNEDDAAESEVTSTEFVTQKALIRQERAAAAAFFTTGVWTTDITGIAAGVPAAGEALQWDKSGSTPFNDLETLVNTIMKRTGRKPNFVLAGADVWKVVKNHADFIDRVKHTDKGPLTEDIVARLVGVEQFKVGRAVYNSAAKGQTASNSFIWDSRSLLVGYKNPTPSRRRPSAGYLFTWNGYYGAGKGSRVKRMEMPLRDSVRIEMDIAFDPKVTGAKLGCFMNGIVSTAAAS